MILQQVVSLPMSQGQFFQFTMQSTDSLYVDYEEALFCDPTTNMLYADKWVIYWQLNSSSR